MQSLKVYESVIVQDLKIEAENIEFQRDIYYSASCKKTFTGKVPLGYEGGYGPSVKSLAIIMKYACNMSENKILDFFNNFGIYISSSTISRMLIKDKEDFHKEKEEIFNVKMRYLPFITCHKPSNINVHGVIFERG